MLSPLIVPLLLIEPTIIEAKNILKKQAVVLGYLQELGCTATSERLLKAMILKHALNAMDRRRAELNFDYIGVIEENNLEKEIFRDKEITASLKQDPRRKGIWYMSGRGFYTSWRKK